MKKKVPKAPKNEAPPDEPATSTPPDGEQWPESEALVAGTFTMSEAEIDSLTEHEFATLFPMMDDEALADLCDGMIASGIQRDAIVLFQGQILDGRNTLKAAKMAGLDPKFREYDPEKEGPAIAYVLDRNLRRRHLGDATQRAAILSAALKYMDEEPTIKEQAAMADVSTRTMSDVKTGEDGGYADEMQAGTMSAATAAKKTREKKKGEPAKKKSPEPEDTTELRAEHRTALKKIHGEQFARAFENGTVLKSKGDIKKFVALSADAQRDIVPYLAEGWTFDKSVKFHNKEIDVDDDIRGLILRAVNAGKSGFSCTVNGYKITVKKAD